MRSHGLPSPMIGFAPDLDPTTPGAIRDGYGFIGTDRGIKSVKSFTTVNDVASFTLPGTPYIGIMGNAVTMFVATSIGISMVVRENDSSMTVTDVTPSGIGFLETAQFTRLGDYIILSSGVNGYWWLMGTSTEWTAQTDLTSKVRVQFPHDDFLVAGTGIGMGEWKTSDARDPTDYTTGSPSLAEDGTFPDTAGNFTAGASLGPYAVLYKPSAIWLGRPAGNGKNWSWNKVPTADGCFVERSLISTKDAHIYIGRDDIYAFNGSRPVSIGAPVRDWLIRKLRKGFFETVQGVYDPSEKVAYWFFREGLGSPKFTEYLSLHVPSGKFGRNTCSLSALVLDHDRYPLPDTTGQMVNGVDWPTVVGFDEAGQFVTLAGDAPDAVIETGFYGADDEDLHIDRSVLRFIEQPTASSCTHTVHEYIDAPIALESTVAGLGRYDLSVSGRWHKDRFTMKGDWEATILDATKPAKEGRR